MVMYGHNWNNLRHDTLKSGNQPGYTMFAQLPSYLDPKFAQELPHIYFSTAEQEGIWRVFAIEYVEVTTDFPYNSPNPTKEYFGELVQEIRKRSIYNFNVDVNADDRIITLSTCTRANAGVGEEQRYIVVARLLREGESEKDAIKLTTNTEYIAPKFKAA
jgi:sortase B